MLLLVDVFSSLPPTLSVIKTKARTDDNFILRWQEVLELAGRVITSWRLTGDKVFCLAGQAAGRGGDPLLCFPVQHSASQKDPIVSLLPLPVVGGLREKKNPNQNRTEKGKQKVIKMQFIDIKWN